MSRREVITIPYRPRRQFRPLHDRAERWAVVVAHRRAGKTVACVNELLRGAITCGRKAPRFAYIAPLYKQAKDVVWGYLKEYSAPIPGHTVSESELRVDYPNGGRVRLYGADNPDALRGIYLDGVVLDEYADMHPGIWGDVIRPALSDRQGWAVFIGTPKGRNAFCGLYEGAVEAPDWLGLMLRASETDILPAEELADARKTMTAEQYAQEYECSFDAAIMGAYYGQEMAAAMAEGRICQVPIEGLPVHTAWDLGIGDSTAIWMWQVVRGEVRVIDYHEGAGVGLDVHVRRLEDRPYQWGDDWVPHDAKVRELGTGRTRVETLTLLGRRPKLVPDHRVEDGINAARMLLPACWLDKARCEAGLEALRQYRSEWDDKKQVFSNRPRHDWTSHAADAFRYLAMAYRELKPVPKPAAPPPVTLDLLWKTRDERRRERV